MAPLTIECDVHTHRRGKGGAKGLRAGAAPPAPPSGRVPRVARLMALALHIDGLVRAGHVANFAAVARLGHVTRARVSQVVNLLNLAPDVQEALLFLPRAEAGRDPVVLRHLQLIALTPD